MRWLSRDKNKDLVHRVRIADVDLLIESKNGLIDLRDEFRAAVADPKARFVVKLVKPVRDVYFRDEAGINGNTLKWDFVGRQKLFSGYIDLDFYHLHRLAGYLAGITSEEFVFCHGAGIYMGGKGVVLVGRSNYGKTTLASMLQGEVLSDDILMIKAAEMQTVGKKSSRTDKKSDVVIWSDGRTESPLTYLIKLDKMKDPDHIEEIKLAPETEKQLAAAMFDDKIYDNLWSAYVDRLHKFRWPAKIFEVGTQREPQETKRQIEYIVSRC